MPQINSIPLYFYLRVLVSKNWKNYWKFFFICLIYLLINQPLPDIFFPLPVATVLDLRRLGRSGWCRGTGGVKRVFPTRNLQLREGRPSPLLFRFNIRSVFKQNFCDFAPDFFLPAQKYCQTEVTHFFLLPSWVDRKGIKVASSV